MIGDKEEYYTAYRITNTINGKEYIGITKCLASRWKMHKNSHRSTRRAMPLYRAMWKHGVDNFKIEPLACSSSLKDICAIEVILIEQYGTFWENGTGYNLTRGGEGPVGHRHSAETRAKMSRKRAGVPHSVEHSAAIAASLTGKKLTPEHREKSAAARRGKKLSAAHNAALHAHSRKGEKLAPKHAASVRAASVLRYGSKDIRQLRLADLEKGRDVIRNDSVT